MNEIKLNKTQKALVEVWRREVQDAVQHVNRLANEILALRLEGLAKDLGIDLEAEEWSFDITGMRFYKIDKKDALPYANKEHSITPVIPSKKRGRPKKEDVIDVEAEISSDDEPELPLEETT